MVYFDTAFFAVFFGSAVICAALILTKKMHMHHRAGDVKAVQASHDQPTPRVGGVALYCGLLLALLLVPVSFKPLYAALMLSLVPVFLAGLLEDLGVRVTPFMRLLAAALSSAVAVALLEMWISRTHLPGIDWLLMLGPVAIVFTLFATTGVCNAFNLIDGLNGLAAGIGAMTALSLAVLAHMTGQVDVVFICFVVIASLMGFLLCNFPWGKIFLGDSGGYLLGHMLAWISIIMMARVPDLSPWAVVLIFFWPLADTLFAIYRRRRDGRPATLPDRLHHHHLVRRLLEIRFFGRRRTVSNPMATLVILPFAALPMICGVVMWNRPVLACLTFVVFVLLFVGVYSIAKRVAQKARLMDALQRG